MLSRNAIENKNSLNMDDPYVERLIEAVKSTGKTGILEQDLIQNINFNKNSVFEVVDSLVAEGIFVRVAEENSDHMDYRIFYKDIFLFEDSFSDLNGCPCFHCPYLYKCGARQPHSPYTCPDLTFWIKSNIENSENNE